MQCGPLLYSPSELATRWGGTESGAALRVRLAGDSDRCRETFTNTLQTELMTGCMNQIWLYIDIVIQLVGHARIKVMTHQVASSSCFDAPLLNFARDMVGSGLKKLEMLNDRFKSLMFV
jgi:hypothetical protein